jgi:hypothetical protein
VFSAQNSWKQEYSSSKVFIENKGQFDASENKLVGEIQYAADFGSTRVFFGKKGVVIDISGKIVMEVERGTYNLQNLVDGVYIYQTSNGKTLKFIKE